jgi:hypothetical protein
MGKLEKGLSFAPKSGATEGTILRPELGGQVKTQQNLRVATKL